MATHDSDEEEEGNGDLPAGWSQASVSSTAAAAAAADADDAFYENSRGFVHRVPSIASAAAAGGGFGSFDAVMSATSAHGVKMAKSRDLDVDLELTDAELLAQVLKRVENKQTLEEAAQKERDESTAKDQSADEQGQAADEENQRLQAIEQAGKEAREAKEAAARCAAEEEAKAAAAALDERRRHHRLLEQKDEDAAEEARKVLRQQRTVAAAEEDKLRLKEEAEEAERAAKAALTSSSDDEELLAKSSDSSGSDPLVAWLEAAKQADVEPAETSIADMAAGTACPSDESAAMAPSETIDNATIGHTAHLVADALQSLSVLDAVSDKMQKSASVDAATVVTAVTGEDDESGVVVEAESVPAPEMAVKEEEGNPFGTSAAAVVVNPFMSAEGDFSEDEFDAGNEEWTLNTVFSKPATAVTETGAAGAAAPASVHSVEEAAGTEEAKQGVVLESVDAPAESIDEEAVGAQAENVADETEADTEADVKMAADADAQVAAEAEKAEAATAEAESLRVEVAKLTAQLEMQAAHPSPTPPPSEAFPSLGLAETPYGTLEGTDDADAAMANIALSDGESLPSGHSSPARPGSGASSAVLDLSSLVAAGGEAEASSVAERKTKKKKNKKKKREEKRKRIAAVESLAATDKDSSEKGRRSRSSSKSSNKRRGSGTGASASESDTSEMTSPTPTSPDGGAGAAILGPLAVSTVGDTGAAAAAASTATGAGVGAAASVAAAEEEGNVMLEFVGFWGDSSRQLKISRVAENRDDFMVEWVGSAHFDPSGITCVGGTPTESEGGLKFEVHSKVGRSEWELNLDVSAGRPVQLISGSAANTRGDQATCTLRRYASADELPAMGKSGKRGFLLKAATSGLKGLAKSKMKQIASMEILKRGEDGVGRVDSKTVSNCVGKQMVRRPGEGLGLAVQAIKGEVGVRVAQVWPNTVAEGAGLKVGMVLVRVDGEDMLNSTYEQIVGALKVAASTFDIVVCDPADVADAIKQREAEKAMKGAPAWWSGGGGGEARPRSKSQSSHGPAGPVDRPRAQSTSGGSASATTPLSASFATSAPPNMMEAIPADAPVAPAAAAAAAASPPAPTLSSMPIVRCFHEVMPSDSFVGLSFKYGVSVDTLRVCNKMSQSDQLFSRKRLVIPEEDI